MLNQKKGVDALSSHLASYHQKRRRAVIEIVREFIYPQNFTPAQIPSLSSTTTGSTATSEQFL